MDIQTNFPSPNNQDLNQQSINNSLNNQPIKANHFTLEKLQSQSQHKASNKLKLLITLFLLLFIFLLSLSSFLYFFIIEPKIKITNFSKKLIGKLPELVSKISRTQESINKIYTSIIQQNQNSVDPNLLLRLDTSKFTEELQIINNKNTGQVAGAYSKTSFDQFNLFVKAISKLANELKKAVDFGNTPQNILGEQSIEPTLITSLRKIKEFSNQVIEFSSEGKTKLEEIRNSIKNINVKNDQLHNILTELQNLNNDATFYFKECSKIADYYYKILDIRIELIPFLASYTALIQEISQTSNPDIYLNRIEELENTITKLHSDIVSFKDEDLPLGINTLHQDNIKTLKLLKDNLREIKSSVILKNYSSFLTAILTLGQNIEPLSTRAVSLEISFWQNNKTLKEGNKLKESYNKVKQLLESLVEENKIPYVLSYQISN